MSPPPSAALYTEPSSSTMIATITPKELYQLHTSEKKVDLVDVRTPAEFAGLHAEGAINHPLDRLNPQAIMQARNGSSDQQLYLICQMGGRSMKACEQFVAAGYQNVVNVEGGTALWEQQGLPVIRGKRQIMAIDRQVRIAAGSLVLFGVILALLATPSWVGLAIAGFIGAGLVFSGVTNTCGMGTVLAMMPWNRAPGEC